jgi:hypothetical protein
MKRLLRRRSDADRGKDGRPIDDSSEHVARLHRLLDAPAQPTRPTEPERLVQLKRRETDAP